MENEFSISTALIVLGCRFREEPRRSMRNQLLLTGCKICCSEGQCGTCTSLSTDRHPRLPAGMEDVEQGAKIQTSKRWEPPTICIRCRSRGWPMEPRNAASAPQAS